MPEEHFVFVIDDDDDVRESVTEMLVDEGYRVGSAANGREALEILAREERVPAVIVLDLMMPVMSGEAFRDRQLLDARLAAVPVIVMSASYQIATIAAMMRADAVITKPALASRLLGAIASVCGDESKSPSGGT